MVVFKCFCFFRQHTDTNLVKKNEYLNLVGELCTPQILFFNVKFVNCKNICFILNEHCNENVIEKWKLTTMLLELFKIKKHFYSTKS